MENEKQSAAPALSIGDVVQVNNHDSTEHGRLGIVGFADLSKDCGIQVRFDVLGKVWANWFDPTELKPITPLNIHELSVLLMTDEIAPCTTSVNPEEARFVGMIYSAERNEAGEISIAGTAWGGRGLKRALLVSIGQGDPEFHDLLFEAVGILAQQAVAQQPQASGLILPPGFKTAGDA